MPDTRRAALAADLDRRLAPLAHEPGATERLARWRSSNALTFLLRGSAEAR